MVLRYISAGVFCRYEIKQVIIGSVSGEGGGVSNHTLQEESCQTEVWRRGPRYGEVHRIMIGLSRPVPAIATLGFTRLLVCSGGIAFRIKGCLWMPWLHRRVPLSPPS